MSIDERLQAITMNLELASHEIQELRKLAASDAENIRALARIAAQPRCSRRPPGDIK